MSKKRILPLLILNLLLGIFSAHRFYVNRPISAIIQILTLGGLGIWLFIDFIMIVTRNFKDSEGNKIDQW